MGPITMQISLKIQPLIPPRTLDVQLPDKRVVQISLGDIEDQEIIEGLISDYREAVLKAWKDYRTGKIHTPVVR